MQSDKRGALSMLQGIAPRHGKAGAALAGSQALDLELIGGTINGVKITFDPAKRQAALNGRGLDFDDAAIAFAGLTITVEDLRRD